MLVFRFMSSVVLLLVCLNSALWAQTQESNVAISVTGLENWVMPKHISIPDMLKPLVGQLVNHRGIPVVNMWHNPMPTATSDAGYPTLVAAEHATIFQASIQTGGYNHHPSFMMHGGKFYATWSNHPKGEDSPGQRVLFSVSDDGLHWAPFSESYPPPRPVGEFEESGYYCVASPWFVHKDKVYACAQLFETMGWENADGTELQVKRDAKHNFKSYRFVARLIRPLEKDETLGPIISLHPDEMPAPGELDLAVVDVATVSDEQAEAARAIRRYYSKRARKYVDFPPHGVDPSRLCEPTTYTATDGTFISLLRDDMYSHRMYVSVLDESTKRWSKALPTNIPDSPSMSNAVTLPDGRVVLIGNQMATAFDNADKRRHYGRDPLVLSVSNDGYRFTSAYALRCGKQQYRVPNVKGRGGGPQYPNLSVYGDKLYVMYSIGKEDIAVTIVPLSAIK
ncbi:MAG TPA: hypothetical protein DER01_12615 [Phycisphaerales bacterium]|nr:hypothetical protein [Phycisphaerales bacterium]